jgi:hypothetical protein
VSSYCTELAIALVPTSQAGEPQNSWGIEWSDLKVLPNSAENYLQNKHDYSFAYYILKARLNRISSSLSN